MSQLNERLCRLTACSRRLHERCRKSATWRLCT